MAPTNSVFISYRRKASLTLALLVYKTLLSSGISTFMDTTDMGSDEISEVIKNELERRPYYLLFLNKGTLENCKNKPDEDWVLIEIKHAIETKRKIIPIFHKDFELDDIALYLPEPIAKKLKGQNGIWFDEEYFDERMAKLLTFLKPIEIPAIPLSPPPPPTHVALVEKIRKSALEAAKHAFVRSRVKVSQVISAKVSQ